MPLTLLHASPGVPHLDRLVPSAAGQTLAVGAEGHAKDLSGVSLEGEKSILSGLRVRRLRVPHLDGPVLSAAGRAAGHAGAPTGALQGERLLTGRRVPHLDDPVLSAAHQASAVGTEGHAGDPTGVHHEGAEGLLTGLRVPHLDRPDLLVLSAA